MHFTGLVPFAQHLRALFFFFAAAPAEAREELEHLLDADELRDACVLVLANKQDLPYAMPAGEAPCLFVCTPLRFLHCEGCT